MTDTTELPRRIEYRRLSEVLPADRNPKTHADDEIQASIQRHGFTEPVFEDGRTGKLVAGHGRLENLVLLAQAGHAVPDGIVAADDGEWMLPVVVGWSSDDDTEAEDYLSLTNRIVELGGWDPVLVAEMYADPDRDLDGTGWTIESIDDLVASFDDEVVLPDEGTDADHADLPPARKGEAPPPRNAQGMRELVLVFQVPQHTEALEHIAVLRRLTNEQVTPLIILNALRQARTAAEAES